MVQLDGTKARAGALAMLFVVALGACADRADVAEPTTSTVPISEVVTTVGAPTGRAAIDDFLAGIEQGSEEVSELVEADQLAVLIGLEETSGSLMSELLTSGVPAGVAENFWESLASSFEPFSGAGLAGWEAGGARAIIADGTTFVFVAIEHETGESELVARDSGDGWVVDLIASFGHAFAPVVNHWMDNDPGGIDVWGPPMAAQRQSVEMAAERTDPGSVYQQDLADWLDRISRLRP